MTVKIVQGLIHKPDTAQAAQQTKAQTTGATHQLTPTQVSHSAQFAVKSDAVVSNISSHKSLTGSEKIKSHKEAKEVSESIADRIKNEGGDVHELGGTSGQVLL
ncbi:MAG: hypothetical protein KDD56_03780 [Bdellovibrionales bacterium]|nr:hypothetical protein [Bdellovibrionales bacterium]